MGIISQIGIPLGTGLAVLVASILVGKIRIGKMFKTLSSLLVKGTDLTARTAHIRGTRGSRGETFLTGSARSPMAIDMKLAQIAQYIKRSDVEMSKEEHLLLSVFMLVSSWDEEMFIVIPPEDMPEDLPPKRTEDEVDITEVEFAKSEMPDTLTVLNPRNYLIAALPGGRYEVTDGEASGDDRLVATGLPAFPDAVNAMCDHHNQRIGNVPQGEARMKEAEQRLAGDLEAWMKLVVPLREHLSDLREQAS